MVGLVRSVFGFARLIGPERSGGIGAAIARRIGPLLPAHRTALANIRAAFPGRSRTRSPAPLRSGPGTISAAPAASIPISDALFDYDPDSTVPGRMEVDGHRTFPGLRDDGKPGMIFSAHLGNWELPAICAARFGLDATAVFRAPNDPGDRQGGARDPLRYHGRPRGGPPRCGIRHAGRRWRRGGHLGMLIDQHFTRGRDRRFHGAAGTGQPDPRQVRPPLRLPGPRRARHPPAGSPLPPAAHPGPRPAAGSRRADQRAGRHAGDDPRSSRAGSASIRRQWLWMHRRWRPCGRRSRLRENPTSREIQRV